MTSAVWFVVVGGVSGGTVAAVAAYRVHLLRVAMRVERAELIKRIDAEKQSVRLELGAIRSVWAELAQDIIRRGATGREIAFGTRMDRLLEWSQTPTDPGV